MQERQRSKADAKAAARRRQQRRNLAYTLGGIALLAVVVVLVLTMESDGGGVGPSAPGEVTVEGSPRDTPLDPGDAVPAFTAPEMTGGTVSWSDQYAGSKTVLSLWAPWCSHCQAELPILDSVMDSYPDVKFVTIVTSIGQRPGPSPDGFMQDHGLVFPVAVDDENGTAASAFGLQVFPTLYFVNADGTVAQVATGEVDEATLRATIDSLA
jgi:thiol-disulfide isomerase/thioredoxin